MGGLVVNLINEPSRSERGVRLTKFADSNGSFVRWSQLPSEKTPQSANFHPQKQLMQNLCETYAKNTALSSIKTLWIDVYRQACVGRQTELCGPCSQRFLQRRGLVHLHQ